MSLCQKELFTKNLLRLDFGKTYKIHLSEKNKNIQVFISERLSQNSTTSTLAAASIYLSTSGPAATSSIAAATSSHPASSIPAATSNQPATTSTHTAAVSLQVASIQQRSHKK